MARAGTTERGTAVRAKFIPQAAEDVANVTMAGELGVSVPTDRLWRSPFQERGPFGLVDGPGTGRPAIYGREIRERIVATTLTLPKGSTHWSTRARSQCDRRRRARPATSAPGPIRAARSTSSSTVCRRNKKPGIQKGLARHKRFGRGTLEARGPIRLSVCSRLGGGTTAEGRDPRVVEGESGLWPRLAVRDPDGVPRR